MNLKYHFTVGFQNGEIYSQAPDDVSVIDPTRSSFFDVQQQENQGNPPVIFTLEDGENLYVVDLMDGHFEVNGSIFHMYDKPLTGPLRLVYFRRHLHSFYNGVHGDHKIAYNFGWQATIDGENVQRVMTIN